MRTIKGGIATYLRDLLPLQCQSWGADRVMVPIPASQRAELAVPDGVQVEYYDDQGSRPLNALRLALRVWSLYRRFQPQVIPLHSTFAGAINLGVAAALAYRCVTAPKSAKSLSGPVRWHCCLKFTKHRLNHL